MVQRAIPIPEPARMRFLAKLAAGLGLLAFGDWLFYGYWGGAVIGIFALAWIAALALTVPAVRRARHGPVAIAAAVAFSLVLVDDPSLLAACLFLVAIGSVSLLPRHVYDHAGRWLVRLLTLGGMGIIRAPADLLRISRLPTGSRSSSKDILVQFALPLLGGGLFLILFANANPVLGKALGSVRIPGFSTLILHMMLWAFLTVLIWPTFRPRAARYSAQEQSAVVSLPSFPVRTLVTTLIVFNFVFALENALDIAFLWSGAPLPADVTLAEYAHRGAYTLIATALLAGLFVLIAIRPGTPAAGSTIVRRLLLVWVMQNIFLVASSMLRLFDYIDAYSLTVLRISALLWMLLVATGLALICWRFLTGRSASWLINANALAAAVVLSLVSVVDLGAVAASWNVRNLRDPARIDLCYLQQLGSPALLPAIELRKTGATRDLRRRAAVVSEQILANVEAEQARWQGWSWRDARRLARARAEIAAGLPKPADAPHGTDCDGRPIPPPPPPESAPPQPSVEIAPPAPPIAPLTPQEKP